MELVNTYWRTRFKPPFCLTSCLKTSIRLGLACQLWTYQCDRGPKTVRTMQQKCSSQPAKKSKADAFTCSLSSFEKMVEAEVVSVDEEGFSFMVEFSSSSSSLSS